MSKTISVKYRKHFKVAIQYKDVILFEDELNKKRLDFYIDCNKDSSQGSFVFYYLLQKNRPDIDGFLEKNGIEADAENLKFVDLSDQKSNMVLYFKLVSFFIGMLVLLKVTGRVINP